MTGRPRKLAEDARGRVVAETVRRIREDRRPNREALQRADIAAMRERGCTIDDALRAIEQVVGQRAAMSLESDLPGYGPWAE